LLLIRITCLALDKKNKNHKFNILFLLTIILLDGKSERATHRKKVGPIRYTKERKKILDKYIWRVQPKFKFRNKKKWEK